MILLLPFILISIVVVVVDSFQLPITTHSKKSYIKTSSSSLHVSSSELQSSYDVIIVGSGIGGLSAAALLSHYGCSVAVLESHYAPGGAAHGFQVTKKDVGTFTFDTGKSASIVLSYCKSHVLTKVTINSFHLHNFQVQVFLVD